MIAYILYLAQGNNTTWNPLRQCTGDKIWTKQQGKNQVHSGTI